MIGAAAVAVILTASAPQAPTDVGPRIAAARAVAQSLQGLLDGPWLLQDSAGRPLCRLEIVDPAGGHGPLVGAWRDARAGPDARGGFIERISRTPRGLWVQFRSRDGSITSLRLTRRSPDLWTGRMIEAGADRPVALRRGKVIGGSPRPCGAMAAGLDRARIAPHDLET